MTAALASCLALVSTATARASAAQGSGCVSAIPAIRPAAETAVAEQAPGLRVSNGFGTRIFGIASGGALQNESPELLQRDIADDRRAGARWMRVDVNWAQIQPAGRNVYVWSNIDALVSDAAACHIKILGTIVYSPPWARDGASVTDPPNPRLYARFAAQAARHLGRLGVHAFEIWNEPNNVDSWSHPNAAAYTRLLRDAHAAIRGVAPHDTVISGGLSPAPNDGGDIGPVRFLSEMYRAGAKGTFDAVAAHPYCFPAYPGAREPWSAWYQMYGGNDSLRAVMKANGDGGKKIWATEFGAPTGGPAGQFVPLATQAAMVSRAYRLFASYKWAGPLFFYQGRDMGDDSSSILDFFGLLTYDFTVKPAFTAYERSALLVADALRLSRRR